jgi:hypothetical protein
LEVTTKPLVLTEDTKGCEPDAILAVSALPGPIRHPPGGFVTVPANVIVATVELIIGNVVLPVATENSPALLVAVLAGVKVQGDPAPAPQVPVVAGLME